MRIRPDRPFSEIAKQWNLHYNTVYRLAKRLGLTTNEGYGKENDLTYEEQITLERALRNRRGHQKPVKNSGKCNVDNCFAPMCCRGWCSNHYEHWRIYGHPTKKLRLYMCRDCGELRDTKARGLCSRCYHRFLSGHKSDAGSRSPKLVTLLT